MGFNAELEEIGIFQQDKIEMLQAIQKGIVILDTPLKSIEEIIDFQGISHELAVIAQRFHENGLEPIQALCNFQGLSLNMIVHFQHPDETLSNRDDDLFFTTLKLYNSEGTTQLIIGSDHGHSLPHPSLWNFYNQKQRS